MSIKVCDAIMGSGKSESVIRYVNEHPNEKYIYITPYLDEAARIKAGCPLADFIEPTNTLREYGYTKTGHAEALIRQGKNLATTHQAFKRYSPEILEIIKQQGYILFIDESLEVLESCDIHYRDMEMLIESGYISREGSVYSITPKKYEGWMASDILGKFNTNGMISARTPEGNTVYFWTLPPELILSFKEVIVLTYLFSCQSLHHMCVMNNIPYEYIGIEKDDDGYRFCESPNYVPEYVRQIQDKIHIVDHPKLNEIGDGRTALSMSWFEDEANVKLLKGDLYNYYRNLTDSSSSDRLWGSFISNQSKLKGNGYTKAFLPFNTKATNKYRDRNHLAYLANVFMNVPEKLFYIDNGVDVNEDMYALSTMIQWIWRSSIRDGEDVTLYLPSSRMRTLLEDWMKDLAEGGSGNDTV